MALTKSKWSVAITKQIGTRTTNDTHNGELFSSTGVQLGRTNSFLSPSNKITVEKFATRALARPPLGCMENSFDFIAAVVYKLAIGKLITGRPARLLPLRARESALDVAPRAELSLLLNLRRATGRDARTLLHDSPRNSIKSDAESIRRDRRGQTVC